jgi:hypothetical protein
MGGKTQRYSVYKDIDALELLEFSVFTNYHRRIEKALWYVKGKKRWEFEQSNKIPMYSYYFPFLFLGNPGKYYRKYDIFCDNKFIGELNQSIDDDYLKWEVLTIYDENYYIKINDKKSTLREELSDFSNEWSIENTAGDKVAFIQYGKNLGSQIIHINKELDIEVVAVVAMMRNIFMHEIVRKVSSGYHV